MADRRSDKSPPDQTDVRSEASSKAARGTRTSSSSPTSQPAKPSQRKTAQPRKAPAKKAGSSGAAGTTAAAPGAQSAPQTPAQTPAQTEAPPQPPNRQPQPDDQTSRPDQTVHERINAAYASSGPVVPDEAPADRTASPAPGKPTGAERFAAAVGGGSSTAQKSGGQKSGTPRPWDAPRRVRKARLRVTHVDPWSVLKTAFLLAVAIGIVTVVAVAVVWSVLDAAGVWGSIDKAVADVVGETGNSFRIEDYLGLSRVLGFTLIVAVVDVVLVTVIATLGAFLYNLAAALLGGVEVVLAEEER